MVSFLRSGSGTLSIYKDGVQFVVDQSHVNYNKIVEKLKAKDYDSLEKLIDVKKAVVAAMGGKVQIVDGQVLYAGEAVHNYVSQAILNFLRDGFDTKPLALFLENLMQNPSKKSVDNLFRFLEVNNHPITEDGCFLAYKRVGSDYKDLYKGKFDNTPGKVVSMPRNEVEDDPNITCAAGLHVANYDYAANHYNSGTGRLVVCKVNPKFVVSVPTDYANAKMRVCEYEVVGDYQNQFSQESVSKNWVDNQSRYDSSTSYGWDDYDDSEEDEEYDDDDNDVDCDDDDCDCDWEEDDDDDE